MQLKSIESLLAKVRSRTDTETASPDDDYITDEFILDALQAGWADLVDFVLSQPGEASYQLLAFTTTLSAGVTDLPEDFYRLVDVRKQDSTRWVPLQPVQGRRTSHRAANQDWPEYEVYRDGGLFKLRYFPDVTTTYPVQITYVPFVDAFVTGDGQNLAVFNNWEAYCVAYACIEVSAREKTDAREHYSLLNRTRDRVAEACARLELNKSTKIVQVETYPEDSFDGWF